MSTDFCCLEIEPHDGPRNMAADEVLLTAAIVRQQVSLRWYRWSRPTVSLGYFQSHDDGHLPQKLQGLDRVRRLSGGGAILHHHEWTYSLALPPGHRLTENPSDVYTAIHTALIDVLMPLGCRVSLRGEQLADRESEFLCFGRGDAKDVVCYGKHKVIGSAQRRRRGAILQHGSVLLVASPFALEFSGLYDLTPRKLPSGEALGQQFLDATKSVLWPHALAGDEPRQTEWSTELKEIVHGLRERIYCNLNWSRQEKAWSQKWLMQMLSR